MIPASNPRAPQPAAAAVGSPLAPEHLRVLDEARYRARKVRRAATVAAVSGGTLALFAVITSIGVLFGDLISLLLTLGLGGLAFNELRGGFKLRRFEIGAPRQLAYNQIALGILIVSYSAFALFTALSDPMTAAGGSTGDAKMDAMIEPLSIVLSLGIYGGMALVGIIGPGLSAWYYFSREKYVRGMLTQTPEWVIHTMRAAA